MKKIVTIGEIMLRLSPPDQQRFVQSSSFEIEFGGSEANVGAALAFWGENAAHLSAFPDHELGMAASSYLRKNGIDTSYISYQEGRMGVYFLEKGAMQRSSKIIYDRKDSVFSNYDGSELDWDEVLDQADWFHWSGITPALSQACADLTLTALSECEARGIMVSGDPNYRSNLWKYGKRPEDIMPDLLEKTNLIIGGQRDIEQCYGKDFSDFSEAKQWVFEKISGLQYMASTDRTSYSSSANGFSATLYTRETTNTSKHYEITHIVDRVGSGDAFAAGLIYGLLYFTPKEAIDFGTVCGVLKHSVPGDVLNCSKEEVLEIMAGENIGKIKR